MKPQWRRRGVLALTLLVASTGSLALTERRLRPEDLLTFVDVVSVAMAPDGQAILCEVRRADPETNQYVHTIWRFGASGRSAPSRLTDSEKDVSPQWSFDGKKIAFLSTRDGDSQIWVQDALSGQREKITSVAGGVRSFRWSPDGEQIAYLAQAGEREAQGSISGDLPRGVVIDKRRFSVYRLMRNELLVDGDQRLHLWVVSPQSRSTLQVSHNHNVETFAWSPDGRRLAFAATADDPSYATASSVFLYRVDTGRLEVALRGEGGDDYDAGLTYTNPLWSPDGQRLAVLQRRKKERWSATGRVGLLEVETGKLSLITTEDRLQLYHGARLQWVEKDRIYLENTYRSDRGLFALSVASGQVEPILVRGEHNSEFSFSVDGRRMAFVRQSYDSAPELYIADAPFEDANKISSFNSGLSSALTARMRRVVWRAPDGVEVEGWLSEPPAASTAKQPWPLLVFVPGGPGYAVGNRFLVYDWPYGFQVLSDRGYAVLFVNYRGTGSYGKQYRTPTALEKEPVDDILSGVDFLVREKVARPDLVGIMGQSHGCWLGAMVMSRRKSFRAASLAEGYVNHITNYAQMSGRLNLNIHDYYQGGSPYENLARYIEISPVFHFEGLQTPTLLEYGDQNLAVQGLDFVTALWRRGIPHEMVIYPKTGHHISAPALQLESMHRNLDWFDYWMLDRKDPDPAKQPQYERWQRMSLEMEQMRSRQTPSQ